MFAFIVRDCCDFSETTSNVLKDLSLTKTTSYSLHASLKKMPMWLMFIVFIDNFVLNFIKKWSYKTNSIWKATICWWSKQWKKSFNVCIYTVPTFQGLGMPSILKTIQGSANHDSGAFEYFYLFVKISNWKMWNVWQVIKYNCCSFQLSTSKLDCLRFFLCNKKETISSEIQLNPFRRFSAAIVVETSGVKYSYCNE